MNSEGQVASVPIGQRLAMRFACDVKGYTERSTNRSNLDVTHGLQSLRMNYVENPGIGREA